MAKVLIIGASDSAERYSYKALKMLESKGHEVYLYSPKYEVIEGHKVFQDFSKIPHDVDVITMYVNPKIGQAMVDDLINLNARLTIFNPGTENEGVAAKLERAGTKTIEACTLVLLTTDQFETVLRES